MLFLVPRLQCMRQPWAEVQQEDGYQVSQYETAV